MGFILVVSVIALVCLGFIIFRHVALKQYNKWDAERDNVLYREDAARYNKSNMCKKDYRELVERKYKKWNHVTDWFEDGAGDFLNIFQVVIMIACIIGIIIMTCCIVVTNNPSIAKMDADNLYEQRAAYIDAFENSTHGEFRTTLDENIINFDAQQRWNKTMNDNFWFGAFISNEVADVPTTGIYQQPAEEISTES